MKKGRPLTFNPDIALSKAMELFWKKGFEATSTADLMQAMGLSKSSLYQKFGSKQQLFEQCLDLYIKNENAIFHECIENASSAKAAILEMTRLIAFPAEQSKNSKGCFFVNSICELSEDSTAKLVSSRIAKEMERTRQAIEGLLAQAQSEGEMCNTKSPKELSSLLMTFIIGLKVINKMEASPETVNSLVEQIHEILA
ncbi:TetR/AcrR family transcriptional regulator [Dongshaea marina]|uniref:TetR/AcrR family transcriptional regulator n=1 Tax=Dongshaea marina TaxID=2047966 RepID=UPI000D3E6A93|nr:TetR/AcrR family transcriptional regulator [Dongshaea marina]